MILDMNTNKIIAASIASSIISACSLPPIATDPLLVAVIDAVQAEWDAAGLPEISDACRPERFTVATPSDRGFVEQCSTSWDKAYGCSEVEEARQELSPVAVVSPGWCVEPSILVHELTHFFARCIGGGDPYHSNPEIWGWSGVVGRATEAVVAQGFPMGCGGTSRIEQKRLTDSTK